MSEFRPSRPGDADAIAAMCQRVLAVPAGSPMFSSQHMQWKYWDHWPDCPGSRSHVLTREGRIVAHGAALPLGFRRGGQHFTFFHLFDWASEPTAIGSGAVLLKRIAALADGMLIVGGSAATQRMVQPLGFRPFGEVARYARTLEHPAQVSATSAFLGDGYTVARLDGNPDQAIPDVPAGADWIHFQRSPQALQTFMRCPAAAFEGYAIAKHSAVVGGFMLSTVPFQTRISALWSAQARTEDCALILEGALHQAALRGAGGEVVCMSNVPAERQALEALGFTLRGSVNIFLLASSELIPDATRIRFQLLDGDVSFLHHGVPQPWI